MRKALLCVLAFLPMLVFAALYKWVDDKGITHYSQTPPQIADQAKAIDISPATGDASQEAIDDLNKLKSADDKRTTEKSEADKKAAKEAADKEKIRKWCQDAHARVDEMSKAVHVYHEDENGKRTYVNQADAIQKQESEIAKTCK